MSIKPIWNWLVASQCYEKEEFRTACLIGHFCKREIWVLIPDTIKKRWSFPVSGLHCYHCLAGDCVTTGSLGQPEKCPDDLQHPACYTVFLGESLPGVILLYYMGLIVQMQSDCPVDVVIHLKRNIYSKIGLI